MNILIVIILVALCLVTVNSFTNQEMWTNYMNKPDYRIIEVPNFLTNDECNMIIEMSTNNLEDSYIYEGETDSLNHDTRKSKQCWLRDDDPFINTISDRIKSLTNSHNKYIEDMQVVNYQPGGFFVPHYDACEPREDNKSHCDRMNVGGPRYLTVLIYLNDDFEGGETIFPNINKSVKPEKGKAVIFENVDENGVIIEQAKHGGQPVTKGQKWIANKWIHLNS